MSDHKLEDQLEQLAEQLKRYQEINKQKLQLQSWLESHASKELHFLRLQNINDNALIDVKGNDMESILTSLLQARRAQLIEATKPLKTFEFEGLPDTE